MAKEHEKKVAGIQVNAFNKTMEPFLRKAGFIAFKGCSKFLYRDSGNQIEKENFYTTALDGDRCFFP